MMQNISRRGCAVLACAALWLGLYGPAARAGDAADGTGCIELEVNGERIRDYACMSRMLAPPAATATPASTAPMAAEQRVRQPPSALGLANRAATQQRMGTSFGVSTQPQRPAPPPAPVRP
ncbi:hypothetical protein [Stenotrophomonas rhizophila]|jgi:hypothetical protein|uniref:hypothetical protein n=1 Tax=Stenotrophomonas rhizophila TaxID=216778 RepID=UPI000B1F4D1E|nr:hypothetical protein [Stenotrophomonas rhizophila]